MKKLTKLGIIASGLVLGISAFAPLTTYAATGTSTVTVTVDPTITLDSITNASITAKTNTVETGTFSARVITNKGYKIQLTTAAGKTALSASGTTDTIPAASTLTAGTNGWGIKKKGGTNATDNDSNASGYTAITSALNDQAIFYSAASGTVAAGVTTTFTVGVAISSTLTAGSYSTQVTVTAANS